MYSLLWGQAQLWFDQSQAAYEEKFGAAHAYRAKVWQAVCPVNKHLRDLLLTFFQIQHMHPYLQNKTIMYTLRSAYTSQAFSNGIDTHVTDEADEHKSKQPDKGNSSLWQTVAAYQLGGTVRQDATVCE